MMSDPQKRDWRRNPDGSVDLAAFHSVEAAPITTAPGQKLLAVLLRYSRDPEHAAEMSAGRAVADALQLGISAEDARKLITLLQHMVGTVEKTLVEVPIPTMSRH